MVTIYNVSNFAVVNPQTNNDETNTHNFYNTFGNGNYNISSFSF